VVAGVAVLIGLLLAAWAIDTGATGADVVRNVSLVAPGADPGVGGSDQTRAAAAVKALAARFAEMPVRIAASGHTYDATTAELGVSVDQPATVAALVDAGRTGSWVVRPFSWARSFTRDWRVAPELAVDRAAFAHELRSLQGDDAIDPVEPSMKVGADGTLTLIPGIAGSGLDADDALTRVLAAAGAGNEPLVVNTDVSAVPPSVSDADAQAVVDHANQVTANGITATAAGQSATIDSPAVRALMKLDTQSGSPTLALDAAATAAALAAAFPTLERPAADARFDLVGGAPVIVPSQPGVTCCGADAPDRVLHALQAGTPAVALETKTVDPAFTTEAAQALGIVQEVGQPDAFGPTTHHAAGEPRVTNIHRIADIMRGVVIKPGETFSVNDYVGERTVAKGFVDAPVIYEGSFSHDVGGGVSQFATTFFNAALYAGLDFGEYQSHSIQISRYPAGHEATISYPHPDLQIKNTTPYGVLVWPTYTDSSVTVHLYSTHFVDVALGGPSQSPSGNCTRWTTPRTRTYVDGHTAADSVHATYRPAEGVAC
jgi:vancomycin resistance protein YoaR